jgi:hypothetical protein
VRIDDLVAHSHGGVYSFFYHWGEMYEQGIVDPAEWRAHRSISSRADTQRDMENYVAAQTGSTPKQAHNALQAFEMQMKEEMAAPGGEVR